MRLGSAFALGAAALLLVTGCVQPAAAPPRDPYAVFPKLPSPTPWAAVSTSLCAHAPAAAPTAWLQVVCPAADNLVAAQTGLRTLARAAAAYKGEEAVANAAYSTQELKLIRSPLDRVPTWSPGAGIVADMRSALAAYGSAIDILRWAFASGPSGDSYRSQATRFLDSGDKTVKRVAAALASSTTADAATNKYSEFLDHSRMAMKEAYAWRELLRVAHNSVEFQRAVTTARNLADWAKRERDWLTEHSTDPCYLSMKQHYLSWVIDPAYAFGEAYTRWSGLGNYSNAGFYAKVIATFTSMDDGYDKFALDLKSPSQTCTDPSPKQ